MPKSVIECCLNAKIAFESDLCANVGIFALMNVCSGNFTQMIAYFLVMNSKRCIMPPKYKHHSEQI